MQNDNTPLQQGDAAADEDRQQPEEQQNQLVSIPKTTAHSPPSNTDNTPSSSTTSAIDSTEDCDNEAQLDMLGPIVLNTDGTMSRISNWSEMTDQEKASAKRLIAKRNKSRQKALSEREGIVIEEQGDQDSGESDSSC
jgi:hypothetical protein